MDFGIASVAAITVIVYIIGIAVKASNLNNKWIPVICGLAGGCLGAAAITIAPIPDFPAKDILTAIAVGIVSGLAATGVNQAVKQFTGIDYHEGYNVLLDELTLDHVGSNEDKNGGEANE